MADSHWPSNTLPTLTATDPVTVHQRNHITMHSNSHTVKYHQVKSPSNEQVRRQTMVPAALQTSRPTAPQLGSNVKSNNTIQQPNKDRAPTLYHILLCETP